MDQETQKNEEFYVLQKDMYTAVLSPINAQELALSITNEQNYYHYAHLHLKLQNINVKSVQKAFSNQNGKLFSFTIEERMSE